METVLERSGFVFEPVPTAGLCCTPWLLQIAQPLASPAPMYTPVYTLCSPGLLAVPLGSGLPQLPFCGQRQRQANSFSVPSPVVSRDGEHLSPVGLCEKALILHL